MTDPSNVPPHNPNNINPPQTSRGGNYILPLILAIVVLAMGFMFLTSGNEADDLAATAPASGTMESTTAYPNQQPINE